MDRSLITVDPTNADQLSAWDGDEGEYWADQAQRFDDGVAAHHRPFMAAAHLQPGERVLDVGCGNGQTTLEAAEVVAPAEVVGIDLSSRMLANLRDAAAASGVANVTAVQGDAQTHRFDEPFDVVLGRTSAMFFGDHAAAFANLRAALRPGGRMVLLTWQPLERNEWMRTIGTALAAGGPPKLPPPGKGPFSLSEPERIRSLLGAAGFTDVELVGNEAPMWLGHDAADAQRFVLGLQGWMIRDLPPEEQERAKDTLLEAMARHAGDGGVRIGAASWITTAVAA